MQYISSQFTLPALSTKLLRTVVTTRFGFFFLIFCTNIIHRSAFLLFGINKFLHAVHLEQHIKNFLKLFTRKAFAEILVNQSADLAKIVSADFSFFVGNLGGKLLSGILLCCA